MLSLIPLRNKFSMTLSFLSTFCSLNSLQSLRFSSAMYSQTYLNLKSISSYFLQPTCFLSLAYFPSLVSQMTFRMIFMAPIRSLKIDLRSLSDMVLMSLSCFSSPHLVSAKTSFLMRTSLMKDPLLNLPLMLIYSQLC